MTNKKQTRQKENTSSSMQSEIEIIIEELCKNMRAYFKTKPTPKEFLLKVTEIYSKNKKLSD